MTGLGKISRGTDPARGTGRIPHTEGMRRPAWNGAAPRDDREARTRIIETTMRGIDTRGARGTNLSNVAEALGVTRQTIYRHFAGTEELFTAVGFAALDHYLTRLFDHLGSTDDPADFITEAMAYTIERLPNDRYLTVLLAAGESAAFTRGATTEAAFEVCRAVLQRSSVPWSDHGYSAADLADLSEFLVRVLLSFLADPKPPQRDATQLRRFLRRWVAPAVAATEQGGYPVSTTEVS